MADIIQFPAGNKATMPELPDRVIAFVRDESALYAGTPYGNLKLCEAGTLAKVDSMTDELELHDAAIGLMSEELAKLAEAISDKLAATPVAAQGAVAEGAELAAVISAVNALITAMKDSGVMSTE